MNARNNLPIILCPTDLMEHSEEVLKMACLLARARGCKLLVLHVVPRLAPVTLSGGVRELVKETHYQVDQEEYRTEMVGRLKQLPMPDPAIPVERRMAEGDVAEKILQAAVASQCDLIVMGANTRDAGTLPLLGSAATEVLQKAHCPVLIVKMPT
jgi:universal stress protein A